MNAMPSLPDLSRWLTDAEASARLGLSPRSLDREKDAGRLHPMQRPVPGRRAERVWDPEEIQARMPTTTRAMQVVSPVPPPMAETSETSNLALAGLPAEALPAIIARLLEMVAEANQTPRPWITLDEASHATGLSRKFLRRLIAQGDLQGIRDVSIKVHRESLEALDVTSALVMPSKKKGGKKR
jgi:hypothetical protein